MVQVLDYSAGEPGALAIARAGYTGAVRYIGFPGRKKCTNRAEYEDFSRHGLGMALVYEDTATDWRGGYERGQHAARTARTHADAIGFPRDRPIYMAIDQDVVSVSEFDVMRRYLAGAASVLGVDLTGVYGEHDACVQAVGAGVAHWVWQCRAWSGSPPRLYAGRHLYQRVGTVTVGGIACDINDVLQADWGQHNAIKEEPDMQWNDVETHGRTGLKMQVGDWVGEIKNDTSVLLTELRKVAAAVGGLTDDEANLLAAIRAQPTGGQVDVQALAAALGPIIPAGATPEQVQEAVRLAFARAGAQEG